MGAPGACGGPCFCVDFAFLAWPCTGSPKVPSGGMYQGGHLQLEQGMPKCDSLNDCYEQARSYYKKPDSMLKPIRSCTIIYQVLYSSCTHPRIVNRKRWSVGWLSSRNSTWWKLDRTEVVIPGRIVLAVIQDRYSTIGLLSVYLHPQTKVVELKELITWVKTSRVDFPL